MFDSKVQKRFFKNVKSIKTKKKGVVSQNCIKTRQITASQELKKKDIFLSKKKSLHSFESELPTCKSSLQEKIEFWGILRFYL